MEKRKVNEQELLFPTKEEWEIIRQTKEINNIPVGSVAIDAVNRVLDMVLRYEELSLGMDYIDNRSWYPYVILKIQGEEQRVFLERPTCSKCCWRGFSGNPFVFDNYIGLPKHIKKFDLMQYVYKYPRKSCPKCNEKLPRPSIWVEY